MLSKEDIKAIAEEVHKLKAVNEDKKSANLLLDCIDWEKYITKYYKSIGQSVNSKIKRDFVNMVKADEYTLIVELEDTEFNEHINGLAFETRNM